MLRSLVRLAAALILASLTPGVTHAAALSGLQYDEIVRVVLAPATPPPPGNFQADLAAVMSPAPVAATAAPKHHGFGNLGAIAGAIVSGNAGGVAGTVGGAAVDSALEAQTDRIVAQAFGSFAGALRGLMTGRLERYSYYSGWERVDDVMGQTATITKCDLHQVINLDLAKKTYSIDDPAAAAARPAPAAAAPAKPHGREATPPPEQPGTAVAAFTNVVTPLAAKRLDGIDASGFDDSSTFAVTQATGSCRDGTFSFKSRAYYARFPAPRLVCPMPEMPKARYPQEPSNFVARGGCRPTFSAHHSGPVPPAQNLALYSAIAASGSAGGAAPDPTGSPAPGFVFLTERGNVHSLAPTAAALFEVPPDFTKAR